MQFTIRKAALADCPAMEQLMANSARGLSQADYGAAQIEAAIADVFGVDTELIHDGTYFAVEHAGVLVGCGGWSRRKTLFGGDQYAQRESGLLDPAHDAAKIRAFFVLPAWARRGIGRALLDTCEAEARAQGFRRCELMATLPGLKLYRACGYIAGEPVTYELGAGVRIEFVPMHKSLA